MTAQDLYQNLKDAADYLGVGFDQISVLAVPEGLRLSHGGREVIVHLPKEVQATVAWEIEHPIMGPELTAHKVRAEECAKRGAVVHPLCRAAP